jgi:hypothetical protein
MTMREVVARDPDAHAVLSRYHIGGCTVCGYEEDDTVARVAEDNGIPTARLVRALNGLA